MRSGGPRRRALLPCGVGPVESAADRLASCAPCQYLEPSFKLNPCPPSRPGPPLLCLVRHLVARPLSRALLARKDAALQGPLRDAENIPVVLGSKTGHLLTDVDGNVFADHVSAWGRLALRRSAAARPCCRDRGLGPVRHGDLAVHLERAGDRPGRTPGRPGTTRHHPRRPDRHGDGGGRGGRQAAREATGRPIILGFLASTNGESTYLTASTSTDLPATRAATRSTSRCHPGALSPVVPGAVPLRPRPVRTTRWCSTTSATGCCATRSSRTRWRGCSSNRWPARPGFWPRRRPFWDGLTGMCGSSGGS